MNYVRKLSISSGHWSSYWSCSARVCNTQVMYDPKLDQKSYNLHIQIWKFYNRVSVYNDIKADFYQFLIDYQQDNVC